MADIDIAYTEPLNAETGRLAFDITTVWNARKTDLTYMGTVYICANDLKSFNYTVYSAQNEQHSPRQDHPMCFIRTTKKDLIKGRVSRRGTKGPQINYFCFPIADPEKDYFVKVSAKRDSPRKNIKLTLKLKNKNQQEQPVEQQHESLDLFGIFYTKKILEKRKELDCIGPRTGAVAAVTSDDQYYKPQFPEAGAVWQRDFNGSKTVTSLYEEALEEREFGTPSQEVDEFTVIV
jgi:hypothetical protein